MSQDNTKGHLKKYTEYIKNVGRPVHINEFDEDWVPVGSIARRQLKGAGLVVEGRIDGYLYLTEEGRK